MNDEMNQEMTGQDEVATPATDQSLRSFLESKNIAEKLDDEELVEVSKQVADGFDYDLRSRAEWEKNLTEWTNLALQVKEEKTWPWTGASNVKYPLLSTAAMQFNARAYPSLIPAQGGVVKCEVIGRDPDGQKLEQAKRVGEFMSYQLLNDMDNWEEDMDKLLIMLPIVGTLFKKTYYNSVLQTNVSELVLPKDVVVNYWAKSLETAERISQVILLNKRQLKERQLAGLYLDIDLGEPQTWTEDGAKAAIEQDTTMPYQIIEQHTYFDIDDDGYAEPYVITFERFTRKVLRIAPRFDDTGIHVGEDGKVIKIDPVQYYTKYSFIPNANGSFYDIGFGLLLTPLNESVNTLINQLIDAGTLSNLQGGFLGKGLKLKMGEQRWTPGEWKTVQTTADDLRKQIMPLPAKEPSNVLFELMGTLITSGKELASVAEIFVGKMPGQNTPATTTMATIEQGMKVFTAVYKRIYRSLKSEYKKLYKLNSIYLNPEKYQNVLDTQISPEDFNAETYSVCPNADPSTPTQTEKLMKAQGLMELLPTGILDPVEVVRRILDAQEQPNPEKLLNMQIQQTGQFQPPPDPKTQELEMKAAQEQQKAALKQQEMAFKSELAAREQQFQQQMEQYKAAFEMQVAQMKADLDAKIKLREANITAASGAMQHQQKLVQNAQSHQQKMAHAKEQPKSNNQQTKTSSKSGKSTQ